MLSSGSCLWCSPTALRGGDETAMELAAEKYQVVFELMTRIEEKLANR